MALVGAGRQTWATASLITMLSRAGAAASVIFGTVALATASCCAVPLALATAGLGGAWLGAFGAFTAYRPLALGVAVAALAAGWGLALARRRALLAPSCRQDRCARRPAGWPTMAALAVATVLTVTAMAWDRLEPTAVRWLISL